MTPIKSRPTLAPLENRMVPAGISFVQGNLVVDGTAGADTVRVYFYGADASRVAVVRQTGTVTESKIVSLAAVKSITVNGGDGNDTLLNDTNLGIKISGGAGDDSIWGGSGNDTLIGDAGDDVLVGRGENDAIDGGAGNDQAFGGDGSDTLTGGQG